MLDDRPMEMVFAGSSITPAELLDLAEFATPARRMTDAELRDEADNLAEWCDDDDQLAAHTLMLAQTRHSRSGVLDVLALVASRRTPVVGTSSLAATA